MATASGRSRTAVEIAVVAGAAALALFFFPRLSGPALVWLVPAVLLYAPIGALFLRDRDFDGCGMRWPDRGAVRDFALFALVVMPVFLAGFFALSTFYWGREFQPRVPGAAAAAELAAWQLLGIALPEEFFFRGWLQGRLNRIFRGRVRILGASVGPGLVIAAAVFALFHLIARPEPGRLVVFFPGLLFGLLRERTRSVAVPTFAHALANLLFIEAQAWVR